MESGITVPIGVALVGCGGWGRNILRTLTQNPRARVIAVADPDPVRRIVAQSVAPTASIVASLDQAIDAGTRAVFIATPPHTQAKLALRALMAGLDVFVEKPLATTPADADRCAATAAALGRIGMVGHLLRHHPAVERLVALSLAGVLGTLRGVSATRLSISGDRSASAFWTLGPHDLSVLHALDPSPIATLAAHAAPSGDPVLIEAVLATGLTATVALSRVGPVKERRICVVGSRGSAVFDDMRAPDRVFVNAPGSPSEVLVPWCEPLALEVDHFLRCVADRSQPRTPFEEGAAIVRVLARAELLAMRPKTTEARLTSG